MTDEAYLTEPVIAALSVSPDERLAAAVLKRASLADNRYEYTLRIRNTASWEEETAPTELGGAKLWWTDASGLLAQMPDGGWGILRIREDSAVWERQSLSLPGNPTDAFLLPDGALALTVSEPVPQDPDFFMTESLPFMEDGKGLTRSFSSLWRYHPQTGECGRLVPERFFVRAAGLSERGVWFTGYERSPERIDFLHSGLFLLVPGSAGSAGIRELIRDGWLRIDFVLPRKGGLYLAASDMRRYGPGQSPDFYQLDFDGNRTLLAENRESASHQIVRDLKPAGRGVQAYDNGIAYLSTVRGEVQLRFVDSGGLIRCICREPGTIDAFHLFPDGRMLAVGGFNWGRDELYVYENGSRRQLTSLHRPERAPRRVRLTAGTVLKTGEARAFDVYLFFPKSADGDGEEKKYPAILSVHGGHKLAYGGDVFMMDFTLWTDEGYFVIVCNPQGSAGGDDSFADIIGRNGTADGADILAALDQVLDRFPQIDRTRIGITGGSYGGYLTNWLITQTDRFACAVSVRGISNRISKELHSDTGFRYPLICQGNRVWEQGDGFWEASPIKHIGNCKTPTLLIHAQNDLRCPVSEGIQMYTALKLAGVPARLLLFYGESHGLAVSGRPLARLKHSRAIRAWFQKYLKPEYPADCMKVS